MNELRLPRALCGILVGVAFGTSGNVIQRIADNPLASPDVIGITAGAATAAVFSIVVLGLGGLVTSGFALVGGLGAAAVIYVLAYRDGVSGYRLVLIGIGITAALTSITQYLMTRTQLYDAQRAVVWLTGSLNAVSWGAVGPMIVTVAVGVPATLVLSPQLGVLELGDDTARALGVHVEAARAALLVIAVTLAAMATAAAGPVAFVALASPQIARRLVGPRSLAIVPSALTGALLVLAADLAGARLFAPTTMPVGVVTAVIGAPFLLYLLTRMSRIGRAG